jgi:sugar O-acyltransferase (sialic acid O-acetyltransferase NeuD family)
MNFTMADPVILIGAGGHCKACIDVIESAGTTIKGVLDINAQGTILGYKILGEDSEAKNYVNDHTFLVTVGQIHSAGLRVKLFQFIREIGGKPATIAASSAQVSPHAKVGEGTIVMHQAIVNAAAVIGKNCIINNKALIEHDAVVGDHTHVSTAAVINGGCHIGNRNFIGSNSVLAQGVETCDDVVIGAGSVVIKSVTEAGTYAGNPAKRISK